jgi:hypothetical protein
VAEQLAAVDDDLRSERVELVMTPLMRVRPFSFSPSLPFRHPPV